jgi:hypothetical protein
MPPKVVVKKDKMTDAEKKKIKQDNKGARVACPCETHPKRGGEKTRGRVLRRK